MLSLPEGHRFTVVPDWVCEVLSPSIESKDRDIKIILTGADGAELIEDQAVVVAHERNPQVEGPTSMVGQPGGFDGGACAIVTMRDGTQQAR